MKRLLILIGTSGSGKTYFSKELKEKDPSWFIISSDSYRIKRDGKVDIFHKPIQTFNSLDKQLIKALNEHDKVIYDACNISRLRRRLLFYNLKSIRLSLEVTGVVFHVPIRKCLRQNKSELRDHQVKNYIILISKILTKFNRPLLKEGFDKLVTPEYYKTWGS